MGLSGLGDLMPTCTGHAIAQTTMPDSRLEECASTADAIAATKGTVEGAHTAQVAVDLAQQHGIDSAIISAVHAILDHNSPPEDEINRLLARPLKSEI